MSAVSPEHDTCTFNPDAVANVLRRQRDLLNAHGQWTRGALARSVLNEAVVPLSERATRWSLTGSIAPVLLDVLGPRVAQIDWQRLYEHTVTVLWNALPADHPRTTRKVSDLDGFNDYPGTTWSDVIELVERALQTL